MTQARHPTPPNAGGSEKAGSHGRVADHHTHTLTFADGRYDLELIRRTCTGTYTTDGDRVSLSNERGVCGPGKLFDATFTITDGVLRFDDFYGIPEIGALTSQPWPVGSTITSSRVPSGQPASADRSTSVRLSTVGWALRFARVARS